MKKIKLNKAYSYSPNGYEVITLAAGICEIPDYFADQAVIDGFADFIIEKKVEENSPENKVRNKWWRKKED